MNLIQTVIGYDQVHWRIDLKQVPAHIITLLLAVWWGSHDISSTSSLLMRIFIAAVFLTITRWTACRLGASRLSSTVAALITIVFFWQTTAEMLSELTIFMFALLGAVEYFKTRNKLLAVIYGVALGLLASVLPDKKGLLLLSLFIGVTVLRGVWHGILERLSKIQLALFVIKTIVIAVLAIGVYYLVARYAPQAWAWQNFVALPAMSPGFTALIVVLALWGLWSTLLLATKRSPKHRGMRLFFVVASIVSILIVALLRTYGTHLFLPQVMESLSQVGLTTYNSQVLIFVIFTTILLITAGIDRTLFKDAGWVRWVLARLN